MGGRGSSSGAKGGATPQQKQKMNIIVKALSKRKGVSAPSFSMDSEGKVQWRYTQTEIVHQTHGGKMISPEKDDIYERTTIRAGFIGKDGYIHFDKPAHTDKLIKKGKR